MRRFVSKQALPFPFRLLFSRDVTLEFSSSQHHHDHHDHRADTLHNFLLLSSKGLGSWSLSKAKKLEWHDGDVWSAQVDLPSGADIQVSPIRRRRSCSLSLSLSLFASDGGADVFVLCLLPSVQYKYAITSHNQEDAKWMPGPNFSVSVPDSALDVKDAWGQAKKEQGMPGNGNGAADLSQADALSKMTVKEIKTLLKDKGLPVSGKKADLIGRLIPHL